MDTSQSDRDWTEAFRRLEEASQRVRRLWEKERRGSESTLQALRRELQEASTLNADLLVAVAADEFAPCSLFATWASVRTFRNWRNNPAVRLDVRVINKRCCVRPSEFLRHWHSLADKATRP